ncbi:MAG: chaperone modulator CbpM [Nitrosospira sp.]
MTNEITTHNKPNEMTTELRGIILDEQSVLTLAEISNACAVQTEYIIELVDEGLITPEVSPEITPQVGPRFSPEARELHSWRFTGMHLRLVRIASHLQSDLGVNLAGVGLALQLLDEVEALRTRLNAMGTTGAIGSS